MTTTTKRPYSEHQAEHFRGVPADFEKLQHKVTWLHDLLIVAQDYEVGKGLLELAHDRIDEAAKILAGALAPWEIKEGETT